MESKRELAYYHAIEQCIGASDWKLDAGTVSCYFGKVFIVSSIFGPLNVVELNY